MLPRSTKSMRFLGVLGRQLSSLVPIFGGARVLHDFAADAELESHREPGADGRPPAGQPRGVVLGSRHAASSRSKMPRKCAPLCI
jgi:hypothetical protein